MRLVYDPLRHSTEHCRHPASRGGVLSWLQAQDKATYSRRDARPDFENTWQKKRSRCTLGLCGTSSRSSPVQRNVLMSLERLLCVSSTSMLGFHFLKAPFSFCSIHVWRQAQIMSNMTKRRRSVRTTPAGRRRAAKRKKLRWTLRHASKEPRTCVRGGDDGA